MARVEEVERALREEHGCEASVVEMSPGTVGYDNQLFLATTVTDSGGTTGSTWPDQVVVRLPSAVGDESARRVEQLRALHEWCAERQYPAVRVLATGRITDGGAYLVLPMVEGPHAMRDLTRPWRTQTVVAQLVGLQLRLHDLPTGGWPGPRRTRDATLSELRHATGRDSAATPIIDWLSTNQVETDQPPELSVGHFDFHPLNIIWPWGGEPTVLDWDTAALGPRAADLAATVELLAFGDAFVGGRLTSRLAGHFGRRLAGDYVTAYCAHHPIDEAELRWWRVVQCAQLLLWRDGATILGTAVRPEALATWSPNLDRVVARRFRTLTEMAPEAVTAPE